MSEDTTIGIFWLCGLCAIFMFLFGWIYLYVYSTVESTRLKTESCYSQSTYDDDGVLVFIEDYCKDKE